MFYENEFEKIWESVVKVLISENSKKLGIKHKNFVLLKFKFKYYYTKYRAFIVKNYMTPDTIRIDRHKISSCIMKATLKVKPLYIPVCSRIKFLFSSPNKHFVDFLSHELSQDEKTTPRKYYLLFNEYLALGIAISVLESYIESDNRPGRFKHSIVSPMPFPEPDEDYMLDVCIGLKKTKLKNVDLISYANIFFLWEKYSCRKKQCDNITDVYKKLLKKSGIQDEEKIKDEVHKALFGELNN